MADHSRITQQQSDDEDEDLELLRLEALKTINKKDLTSIIYHNSPNHHESRPSIPHTQYESTHVASINVYPKRKDPSINSQNIVYYPPVQSDHSLPPIVTRSSVPLSHVNNYETNRQILEKLDVNEPYIPQRISTTNSNLISSALPIIPTPTDWVVSNPLKLIGNGSYVPYVPHKISENLIGIGNVQLSPRSMAFVAENNDILMRRKSEKPIYESGYNRSPDVSPGYNSPKYSSPSPTYRPFLTDRWSQSPISRSVSRSPAHRSRQRRRTSSRSPKCFPRSPTYCPRRKTISKSPSRNLRHSPSFYNRVQSKSPLPLNSRRDKSRSPIENHQRNKTSPRRVSRSPNLAGRYGRHSSRSPLQNMNGRRRSPHLTQRFNNKSRGNSPTHSKKSPVSRIPDSDEQTKSVLQKNRSPVVNQVGNNMYKKSSSPRIRSRSRSPNKRYPQKRSRDFNSQMGKRRSPYDRNVRRNQMNGFKNRRKHSNSPMINKRKRSRTKSTDRMRRDYNRFRKFDRNDRRDDKNKNFNNRYNKNNVSGGITRDRKDNIIDKKLEWTDSKERKFPNRNEKTKNIKKEDENYVTLTPVRELENQKDEHEPKTPTKKEEKNNDKTSNNNDDNAEKDEVDSDSNDSDDGIDLFASDESESENEGRFKLHSGKNERNKQVSTLSFSKLGETIVADIVKDLQDVTTSNNSCGTGRSSNYDSRRRDDNCRFKKSSNNRRNHRNNNSSDKRRNNNITSNSNRDRKDRERDETTFKCQEEKKGSENRPMFKSTFTLVESEVAKTNGKISSDKDVNDKKGIQLKRKLQTKLDKNSTQDEDTLMKQTSVTGTSSNVAGGKKPIHMRLGAMTNTFKPPKKASNWAQSSSTATSSSVSSSCSTLEKVI